MRKLIVTLSIVSIIAFGTIAFAQGMGVWGGGHMMGPGYGGGHMMGPVYGGHMSGMMRPGYGTGQTDQKFLDETVDLRKELHDKRFEYDETARNPDSKLSTIRKLEKEIYELERKIYEKAPRTSEGYGPSW